MFLSMLINLFKSTSYLSVSITLIYYRSNEKDMPWKADVLLYLINCDLHAKPNANELKQRTQIIKI